MGEAEKERREVVEIGDPTLADGILDRLVHNAEIIAIDGESYRLKEARERTEQRARQRRSAKT